MTTQTPSNTEPPKSEIDDARIRAIIKRLSGSLLITGLTICLIIFGFAVSQALYNGIGPVKLVVLIIGVILTLAGAAILIIKPQAWIKKHPVFWTRITLITEGMPEENIKIIRPVRWAAHIIGLLGIIIIYSLATNEDPFIGFGPLRLAGMALFGLIALAGLTFYLPPLEKFIVKRYQSLKKFIKSIANLKNNLKEKTDNFSAQQSTEQKGHLNSKVKRFFIKTTLVIVRIILTIVKIILFGLLFIIIPVLIFLLGRELYRITIPEPVFYKRLIRGILLAGVVVIIIYFPNIKQSFKTWRQKKKEKINRFFKKNFVLAMIPLTLMLIVFVGEVYFRSQNPDLLSKPASINPLDIVQTFPYDYFAVTKETGEHGYDIIQPEDSPYIIVDYAGVYFNVKDGIRLTTNQPSNPQNTIYMAGSNLLYSMSTPDELTPTSLLQEEINNGFNEDYAVKNISAFYYFQLHTMGRISKLDIQPGDIVIAVVGTRDADKLNNPDLILFPQLESQNVVSPSFVQDLKFNREDPHSDSPKNVLIRTHNFLLNTSAFYNKIAVVKTPLPDNFISVNKINKIIELTAKEMAENIKSINQIVEESGGQLIVILEPNLFTLSEFSERELALQETTYDQYSIEYRQWTIPTAYEHLREELKLLESDGIKFYDLTDIFDPENRGTDEEVYIVWDELNHIGNQRFAEAVFEILQENLPE